MQPVREEDPLPKLRYVVRAKRRGPVHRDVLPGRVIPLPAGSAEAVRAIPVWGPAQEPRLEGPAESWRSWIPLPLEPTL